MTNSSEVKRYRVSTLPGRITRDCPEVVLASDFERVQRERDDWKAACLGHGEKASKLMRELDAARAEVAKVMQQRDTFHAEMTVAKDRCGMVEIAYMDKQLKYVNLEAEVAKIADVRDSWCAEYVKARDERDALRALIEAHNANVTLSTQHMVIPLPGGEGEK